MVRGIVGLIYMLYCFLWVFMLDGYFSKRKFNRVNDRLLYFPFKCFRKFVGFKLLEYFATHPSCEVHLKELARRVKIYCDMFERESIIISERKGNLRLFRLNFGGEMFKFLMGCRIVYLSI